MISPLRHRPFRHQFIAQAISMTGSTLTPVAVAFGVLHATGSAKALGLVMAAYSVPMLVLMLAGGVWADRLPRHRLMMTADAALEGIGDQQVAQSILDSVKVPRQ